MIVHGPIHWRLARLKVLNACLLKFHSLASIERLCALHRGGKCSKRHKGGSCAVSRQRRGLGRTRCRLHNHQQIGSHLARPPPLPLLPDGRAVGRGCGGLRKIGAAAACLPLLRSLLVHNPCDLMSMEAYAALGVLDVLLGPRRVIGCQQVAGEARRPWLPLVAPCGAASSGRCPRPANRVGGGHPCTVSAP